MNFVGTDDEDNAAGGQMAELTWKHGYQMFWAVGGILTLTVVFLMHRKVSDPPPPPLLLRLSEPSVPYRTSCSCAASKSLLLPGCLAAWLLVSHRCSLFAVLLCGQSTGCAQIALYLMDERYRHEGRGGTLAGQQSDDHVMTEGSSLRDRVASKSRAATTGEAARDRLDDCWLLGLSCDRFL